VSGRLISVTVIGTTGSKRVSGDVFRSVFNANNPAGAADLRSNLFDTKPMP
jgi:peptidoglycan hydrolase-like amidase